MTSEDQHGTRPQPPGLCATVDRCRRAIDLKDYDLARQLLEELKGEAQDLRGWGEDWKDIVTRREREDPRAVEVEIVSCREPHYWYASLVGKRVRGVRTRKFNGVKVRTGRSLGVVFEGDFREV